MGSIREPWVTTPLEPPSLKNLTAGGFAKFGGALLGVLTVL